MMKYGKALTLTSILILLALPLVSLAAVGIDDSGAIPIPRPAEFGGCGILSIFFGCAPAGANSASQLILGLISIALSVAGLVAVLFLIVGGFRYIVAAGNEEQVESAKKTITHAIIGLVIIILSFVIVRVISNALIGWGV